MNQLPRADHRPIDARILDSFDALTEGERRLAEVVLEAQGALRGFAASELAARAQVSNATAARFFQHLGYKSYHDARLQSRRAEAWGSPLYELFRGDRRAASDDFAQHLAQDIQNLSRTAALLRSDVLSEVISMLAAASVIWVVGFRNSYVLASYARALLVQVKSDVRLLPVAGMTLAEDLVALRPDDVLFVMGFRRRPVVLRALMARAREIRARSILLTDLTAARTAEHATVTLRCHNRGHSLFDSYAAPISVINHVCSAAGLAAEKETAARLAEIERIHNMVDQMGTSAAGRRRRRNGP